MTDSKLLGEAARLIKEGGYIVAFTGAGISVESGIPPFRGADGLWSKYDPAILDLDRYFRNPEESWPVIKELFYDFFRQSRPNPAHILLSKMEKKGMLEVVITQNIDNLHQEAGSKNIIEYHGNSNLLLCTICGKKYDSRKIMLTEHPPRCKSDQGLLKPDFVFFGEMIPEAAAEGAMQAASKADVMLLIGTTGEVMPASMIPQVAKKSGCKIIEFNTEESRYTKSITDVFLKGKAGDISRDLSRVLKLS